MRLDQLQQRLGPLEADCASAAMLSQAEALMGRVNPGTPEQAYLFYVIGKGLVGLGRHHEALVPLQHSLQLAPQQAHTAYLLGFAQAAEGQWLAALDAQRRSTRLDPAAPDAWFELGRAALALGEHGEACAALASAVQVRPDWPAASHLLLCARVRLALESADLPRAAAVIQGALAQDRPEMWLLLEWLELAGSNLLAGSFARARALLQPLTVRGTSLEACSVPMPRRMALVLLLVLELIDPHPSADGQPAWAAELRESLWLPPCQAEQSLWSSLLEPALRLLLARVPERFPAPELGRLLIDSLPAVEPAGVKTKALYRDLSRRLHAPPLQRSAVLQQQLQGARGDLASLRWLPDVLQVAKERLAAVPSDGSLRHTLDQHLFSLSQAMLDLPDRLVAFPGHADTAASLRRETVPQLAAAAHALITMDAQAPVAPRGSVRRHWLLLASRDLPQCVLYRVEQKRQQLERLGCSVRVIWREELDAWHTTTHLLWADAVVVCRLAGTYAVLRAMALARRFGLLLLYDVDDLIFDPEFCPPPFASYGGTLNPVQYRRFGLDVPLVSEAIRQTDGLIVSTQTLADRWRQLDPSQQVPVWVLPNLAPPELERWAAPPQPNTEGPLRLVVASGTTAHKQAWHHVLVPALVVLLGRNPQLELDLLGHIPLPGELARFEERVRCCPFTDYGSYLRQMRKAHVGLVVLEPGVFTDAKSAIRWMEFSYLGLASVLSPTATYTELLRPDQEAVFASTTEQWIDAVQALVDRPELRLRLAAQAQQRAHQCFDPARAAAFWQPFLRPSHHHQPTATGRKRRLLVINVFFAPQSVGGATRVAQDQVRQLLETAGDRYDVTVLCADYGPWQQPSPLAVDQHDWHGARVVRLALPPRSWRDHHDPQVEEFCREWFAREGFDLIHAHCVQQLTAAPLQVAAAMGIPYLVTLHDAWWLSPRLFLTTVTGQPIDPADALAHYDDRSLIPQQDLQQDLERRAQLDAILAAAKARIAVSAPFAEVYRQGGVCNVVVVENDWQPMPQPRESAREPHLPLRLCFLGGMAIHKGYAVLQAALLRVPLAAAGAGAQLTIVDATLQPGQSYDLTWNGTPVHCIPPVPMADMPTFYGNQDVLVAPSIWPESYGLVTREALSAGLWVVASNIGALGQPIEEGVNGNLVPPNDPDALAVVLEQLCSQHPTPRPLIQFQNAARAIDQLLPLYEMFVN